MVLGARRSTGSTRVNEPSTMELEEHVQGTQSLVTAYVTHREPSGLMLYSTSGNCTTVLRKFCPSVLRCQLLLEV